MKTTMRTTLAAVCAVAVNAVSAAAGPIHERLDAGDNLRLGFSTAVPWAYPGDDNEPLGFANALAMLTLGEMGYTEFETSVNEWGGLIPGLQAKRYDIITGGMYILGSRCENINFSDPIGVFGDAMIVPAGNPKGINNYQDIIRTEGTLVTGAGFNTVEAAKREGVPDDQMLLVAGETEIFAALRSGRADAAILTYFSALEIVKQSDGAFEVTDPSALPEWTQNWVGIGFRKDDEDFRVAFNEAMATVIGTDAWLEAAAPYGYTAAQLPGEDASTEFACANR